MPWPCTLKNILSGIDITVCHIATERTEMGPHRKRFLHDLATFEALLRGEARVHSDHCVPSSLSLVTQDVEERAPGGVQDGFRQGMVLHHVENTQLLNRNHLVLLGILFGGLIVEISPWTSNLQMRLGRVTGSLTSAFTAFLPTADLALLAPE